MKKFLALLFCLTVLSATICYAESNPRLQAIKATRKAQNNVCKQQIKAKQLEIEKITLDTNLSNEEKQRRILKITNEMAKIYEVINENNRTYQLMKQELK